MGLDREKESKKDIIIGYEKLEEPNDCDTVIDFISDLVDEVVVDNHSPLIICFDDAQLFDEYSWEVLQALVDEKKPKVMFLVNSSKIFLYIYRGGWEVGGEIIYWFN